MLQINYLLSKKVLYIFNFLESCEMLTNKYTQIFEKQELVILKANNLIDKNTD